MALRTLFICLIGFSLGVLLSAGCMDEVEPGQQSSIECAEGESVHPIHGVCVSVEGESGDSGDRDSSGDGGSSDGEGSADGEGDHDQGGDDEDPIVPCANWECEQVDCPAGQPRTSISGRVTIPAGTLPLPDVSVYVPNGPLAPITSGASCERCEDQLSGAPLVRTVTNLNGEFWLLNAPAGRNVPLVIQIGKWRREILLDEVLPCQDNLIEDEELTRLPRNQSEGNIPKIAVSTGGWDALECLVRKIGIDEEEMTNSSGNGAVHLFAGQGGTNRFRADLHGGASFQSSNPWWNSLSNLVQYDILLLSCEGAQNASTKNAQARANLYHFTRAGGRVFLSHWHNYWLEQGPQAFQSVANWRSTSMTGPDTAYIDSSFPKGELLQDWMVVTGTEPEGEVPIDDVRGTIESINQTVSQRWLWLQDNAMERVQYFSFNTPVGAEEDQQCGRVVFSDIHVAAQDNSSTSVRFPDGCVTEGFSPQEKALVFMFFDLANCIIPDGKAAPL